MRRNPMAPALLLVTLASPPLAGWAQADKPTINPIEGGFDFVDANAGAVLPQQIPAEDDKKFHVLDVRDAAQVAKEPVPGALNIECRQVFSRRASLPRDKTILGHGNAGSFAAQEAMAPCLDGFENVRLLYGVVIEWNARGGQQAHARAAARR